MRLRTSHRLPRKNTTSRTSSKHDAQCKAMCSKHGMAGKKACSGAVCKPDAECHIPGVDDKKELEHAAPSPSYRPSYQHSYRPSYKPSYEPSYKSPSYKS